jgi:hypothetical protein
VLFADVVLPAGLTAAPLMVVFAPATLRAKFGLPDICPASWVPVMTAELFNIAPFDRTSNCEYVFIDTPAPEGFRTFTCGMPLAVLTTFGAFAPEGTICASASARASPATASAKKAA